MEDKLILEKAAEAREKLENLRGTKNAFEFFTFYNANQELFKKADDINNNKRYKETLDKFNNIGICDHYLERIYPGTDKSTLKDTKCKICGEINYYLGDD